VWVILLRASGDRAFSVGGDLKELIPAAFGAGGDVMNTDPGKRWFGDVYTPIVCAVQGLCLGGGMEIVLGTDLRVVSSDLQLGLPEAALGLIPGSGSSVRLPQTLPWVTAMELLLEAQPLDAEAALNAGLVNEVVEPERLQERALERARALTKHAPLAIRAMKEIALRSRESAEDYRLEHEINGSVIRSGDARRGIEAFRAKTTPQFENN
jgi:enoyl-CoA hydratase/carnithine racemase